VITIATKGYTDYYDKLTHYGVFMKRASYSTFPATVCAIALFAAASFAEVLIPASNTNINYYGRFDVSTASEARFNWSGSMIEASFTGTSIGIELTDGNTDYDIEIDGKHHSILRTTSATKYSISTSLTNGTHTIRIMQRSENHWNGNVFKGFYVADGNGLVTPPNRPSRRIEFIGDSWTAGYGNESTSRTCSSEQLRQFTNANKSFSKLTADAFHAECMALAWSGAGIVRNYGESTKKSASPYPVYYDKTLGAVDGKWDFTKWKPDLVFICLGTNDFSTQPYPDDTMYINGYNSLLSKIHTNYGNVPVILAGTSTGPMNNYVQSIVNSQKTTSNHPKTYYFQFPDAQTLTGCDWHPSLSDDVLVSKEIVKSIMTNIGWDTAVTTPVVNVYNKEKQYKPGIVITQGSTAEISLSGTTQHSTITVSDLSGRVVFRSDVNGGKPCYWNFASVNSGVYIIRNEVSRQSVSFVKR
jgi:lysophospholipase L1-like esterase